MTRITQNTSTSEALEILRQADGYYITNTARDLSQSDYKNRILLHTDLMAAKGREAAGYFSLEITGGASIHVDMLRDLEKEKMISEDELFEARDKAQELTDDYIKQIDEIGKAKEAEILEG